MRCVNECVVSILVPFVTLGVHSLMFTCTQDWALPANVEKINISWHVPSHKELQAAEMVMSEFLQPQLDSLEEFMQGRSLSRWGHEREELEQVGA